MRANFVNPSLGLADRQRYPLLTDRHISRCLQSCNNHTSDRADVKQTTTVFAIPVVNLRVIIIPQTFSVCLFSLDSNPVAVFVYFADWMHCKMPQVRWLSLYKAPIDRLVAGIIYNRIENIYIGERSSINKFNDILQILLMIVRAITISGFLRSTDECVTNKFGFASLWALINLC